MRDGLLKSIYGAPWTPNRPYVAVRAANVPHHDPGIYSQKERGDVETWEVFGKCGFWGDVIEHEHGFRARYAYPVELWTWIPEHAEALGKYNVPVHQAKGERPFDPYEIFFSTGSAVFFSLWGGDDDEED